MAAKKAFLLRTDPALLLALQRMADDELRSVNAQIDILLREGLRRAGRKIPPLPLALPSPPPSEQEASSS